MRSDGEPTRAMILSGGSAYAAYEVGVMKALFRGDSPATNYIPLAPEVYVGTSAGSINAAVITSRSGNDPSSAVSFLEGIWIEKLGGGDPAECRQGAIRVRGDVLRFLDPRCFNSDPLMPFYRLTEDAVAFLQFGLSRAVEIASNRGAPLGRRVLEAIDVSSLISIEVFTRVIYESIDLKQIRATDTALLVATTNWRTGELRVFSNADMTDEIGHDVVQASTRFPGLTP